jgi:hypothetical protein
MHELIVTVQGVTKIIKVPDEHDPKLIASAVMSAFPSVAARVDSDGGIDIYALIGCGPRAGDTAWIPPSPHTKANKLNRKDRQRLRYMGGTPPYTYLDQLMLRNVLGIARLLRPSRRHRGGLRRDDPRAWIPHDDAWAFKVMRGHTKEAKAIYLLSGEDAMNRWLLSHLSASLRTRLPQ